ncbi:DNA alkylation repair protein [Georgenia wangjunii]|uniref:DNA alkylation repair protein n=1 Tax=Georgenia wangjunii TaxID=3117730 RepID=UPI002F263E24
MPFADDLIGTPVATALANAIRVAAPGTALSQLSAAGERLTGLSLRERSDLLRDALLADIPGDYGHLAEVVRSASGDVATFRGWLIWPVTSAVAVRATQEGTGAAFADAMSLLAELTGRLTSEFALRTLLRHDLDGALDIIGGWTESPDEHVRRLASEGTRPYLPWAVRVPELSAQPGRTLALLDALHQDPSEYVRRSVANHLNDLSRDAPDLVVRTATRWLEDPAPTTPAVARRGLRTLVKRGHVGALALLGFEPATVDIDGPHLAELEVPWAGSIRFRAVLGNVGTDSVRLAIDYVVQHRKANGTLSPKVFKLATRTLAPGEEVVLQREHSFRQITTRRYHPGTHAVALQVNGIATEAATFTLLPPTGTSEG